MPREQLQRLQVEKLRKTIEVCLNSPFYGKRLGELGITPESIQTVEDIRKIPFTTKADLRDNYPFGLVGGNMEEAMNYWLPMAQSCPILQRVAFSRWAQSET